MVWKPDRLLKAILIWTMLTLLLVWLPLVRGLMDGDSYQWRSSFWGFQLGGRGVHGHCWLVILQALFGIALLYLGWRRALVLDASLPGGLIEGSGNMRYAQTMAFTTLVFFSLFTVFNARSDERSAFAGLFSNKCL